MHLLNLWIFVLVLMSDGLVFKSPQTSDVTKYACAVLMIIMVFLALATVLKALFETVRNSRSQKKDTGTLQFVQENIELTTQELVARVYSGELEQVANFPIGEVQAITVHRRKGRQVEETTSI
jgi:hypothetical protein